MSPLHTVLSFLHLSDINIAKIETDIIGLVRCEYNDIAITHCWTGIKI